jgi:oligopeptide transport system substrate-binding protein
MKKLLVVLTALVLVFSLSACKKDDAGVLLNWNLGADPKTLDPGLNGASDGGHVINNTFEGLVREINGEVLPGMAESWETSADGKTVTFSIRDNAKWSDGTAITADDFVRSWLRGMDPRNASEYSWLWEYTNVVGANDFAFFTDECNNTTDVCNEYDDDGAMVGSDQSDGKDDSNGLTIEAAKAAVGIKSLDDGATFEVKLVSPTNWFVSLMAFYHFMPVPDTATVTGDGQWAKNPELAISNGPYKLSAYEVGDHLELVKNDEYWNADEVGIDTINAKFITLESTAYAQYYADELDILMSVPNEQIPALMATSQDEYQVFAGLGTYYVNFNLSGCEIGGDRVVGDRDNTVFCNANLREALALSINREEIVTALAAGQIPAAGFISKGFMDHNEEDFFDNSKNDSDIVTDDATYAQAKVLFQTAAEELYPNETPEAAKAALIAVLNTKEYRYNTSESHEQVAVLFQAMWKENLGFEVVLAHEEWALFQATRTAGDFDIARGGWLTDFMDPSGMLGIFKQGVAYNDCDYSSPAFEAKLDEAGVATTAEAHFTALYEAHKIFMTDMPVVPVYHYNSQYLIKTKVVGWGRSVLGSIDFSRASIEED